MTAYPAWTPASRPGIIPLHPLGFGTILGRSFAALRQNPRVLLGFALIVQTLAYLVVLAAIGGIAFASFVRLDTLRPGTDEYEAVFAGSVGITFVAGLVLSMAAGALGVIVQGIVVAEVAHAAVAEKLSLRALWRRIKPIVWRLIGYSFLLALAVILLVTLVVVALVTIGIAAPLAAVGLTVFVILAAIPLTLWLMIKLLLAPAAIILEHATLGGAISRSWTLTRGRFWPALGIIILISLVFGFVAQVISVPASFLSSGLATIIAPTGANEPTAIIGMIVVLLLTQIVTLLLQAVAVVVQSTATAIIYIDCRMRREGLDLDLLSYVERRDAGATALPDPYREHIGRTVAVRAPGFAPHPGQPYPAPAYPAAAYPGQPYPQQPYAGQQVPAYPQPAPAFPQQQPAPGYPVPAHGYPAAPAYSAPQPYGRPPASAASGPAPGLPPYSPAPQPPAEAASAPPTAPPKAAPAAAPPTQWAPPAAQPDTTDRESPWA